MKTFKTCKWIDKGPSITINYNNQYRRLKRGENYFSFYCVGLGKFDRLYDFFPVADAINIIHTEIYDNIEIDSCTSILRTVFRLCDIHIYVRIIFKRKRFISITTAVLSYTYNNYIVIVIILYLRLITYTFCKNKTIKHNIGSFWPIAQQLITTILFVRMYEGHNRCTNSKLSYYIFCVLRAVRAFIKINCVFQ